MSTEDETRPLKGMRFAADLRRQFEELAGSAATSEAPSADREARRPLLWRALIVAAVACLGLVAVALGSVYLLSGSGGKKQGAARPQTSAHTGARTLGPAPPMVGDEFVGMGKGLDGVPWVWGDRRPRNGLPTALVERWTGQSWQAVSTPAGRIEGVAALSSDDLWIAENTPRGGRLTQWNGATWRAFPSINFADTSETSNALLALSPNDIWAVGSAKDTFANAPRTNRPLGGRLQTLHWDGKRWSSVPAPALGRGVGNVSLRLVRGVSPYAVWALGDYEEYHRTISGGRVQWVAGRWVEFLLQWDGARWTREPWPTQQLATNPKDEIAIEDMAVASDGELWCAGQRWFGPDNTGDLYVPVVLRLQAGRWQIMASSATPSLPADWKQFMPTSISLTSAQDVWVAGGSGTGDRATLWHWNGQAWSVVDLRQAQAPDEVSNCGVLAVAANDVWAFSTLTQMSDTLVRLEPLFHHFNGTSWSSVPATPAGVAQP
jgi:hypothetical protein